MRRFSVALAIGVFILVGCGGGASRSTTEVTSSPAAQSASAASPVAAAPAQSSPVPAPAAAPTAAPTVAATVKVEVADYAVVKGQFATRIVGYLVNNGNAPATSIQVAASLLDAGEKAIAAQNAIYMREVLPPGETTPFVVQFTGKPEEWAKERLQVQAQPYRGRNAILPLAEGLKTLDVTLTPPTRPSTITTLSGQVKNEGAVPASLVAIIGIGYSDDDKPVWADQTFAKLDQIDPGMTAPFSFSIVGVPNLTKYEVFVQGREKK